MAYWLPEEWHRIIQAANLGTAAAGLYALCGSFIADTKTDGLVPTSVARMYGTNEWIAQLVDAGFWTVEEKGFRDNSYFEWGNKTADEIKARKKQAAARQRKYQKSLTDQSRVTDASVSRQATRPPFPTPYGGKGRGALRAAPPDAHQFDDDGQGHCLQCPLPYANAVHGVAS